MIKKFEDYIKEGFLSKTLGRAKSGESRLEDKNHDRQVVDDFITAVYEYSENEDNDFDLWCNFLRYVKFDECDYGEYGEDWGTSDVLDKYNSFADFIDKCEDWISLQKYNFGDKFDHKYFVDVLSQA